MLINKKHLRKYFNLLSIFLIISFLATCGFGCKTPSQQIKANTKPITLNYWRVYDGSDAFDSIITDYQTLHPNITINIRTFRYEEYEQQLLQAWAEDRGPDIYSIPESWLGKYQSKIHTMPAQTTMVFQHQSTGLQKEIIYEMKTTPTPTLRQLKDDYPDIVTRNLVIGGKVYGLPLSLDTLVMFYNKDIFNNSGIVTPPATWSEFQADVQKIVRFGANNKIVRAGTAMGTGTNVERCFDLLSVLMMQNGADMTGGMFLPNENDKSQTSPGSQAVAFYTDFAMPLKSVYTWSVEMPNALSAFMAGQVGMVFGYNFNLSSIRSQAPGISFGVAPIPQVNASAPSNYTNYWIETVSWKSTHPNEAWDFILFMSQKQELAKYLAVTQRPAPLKSMIASQAEDEYLHAASTQTLTADNWYRGSDAIGAENVFKDMVNQYLNASSDEEKNIIIHNALSKLMQTL